MKDEKKYYVVGTAGAGARAEIESFFRISSKKTEFFVLPWGDMIYTKPSTRSSLSR